VGKVPEHGDLAGRVDVQMSAEPFRSVFPHGGPQRASWLRCASSLLPPYQLLVVRNFCNILSPHTPKRQRVPIVWGDRRSDTRAWIEGLQKELDHHIGEHVVRCTTSRKEANKTPSHIFQGSSLTSPTSYYSLHALR
jgi:hypothetical protein